MLCSEMWCHCLGITGSWASWGLKHVVVGAHCSLILNSGILCLVTSSRVPRGSCQLDGTALLTPHILLCEMGKAFNGFVLFFTKTLKPAAGLPLPPDGRLWQA